MIAKECEVELTLGEKAAVDSHKLSLNLPLDIDLTYEDVYMKERYSKTRSRSDIPAANFRTRLLPNLELGIPIISANMESGRFGDYSPDIAVGIGTAIQVPTGSSGKNPAGGLRAD